jgi:hypothetical protein
VLRYDNGIILVVSRGSRDGMYRKNNRAVRETQYGDGTGPSTDGYKVDPKVHWPVLGVGGVHSTV